VSLTEKKFFTFGISRYILLIAMKKYRPKEIIKNNYGEPNSINQKSFGRDNVWSKAPHLPVKEKQ